MGVRWSFRGPVCGDGAIGIFSQDPSYGWPLIWRWRNVYHSYGPPAVLDQNYSAAWLTCVAARWSTMTTFAALQSFHD